MLRFLFIISFLILPFLLPAQFPPAADQEGTTALAKEDPSFINWATGIEIIRGQQNISDDSLNFAEVGEPEFGLGFPDNQIVSLGDSGVAILTFENPIRDGDGFDFAVFENGFPTFGGFFLELAFVEVSSDGDFFVRFPATSLTDTTKQLETFDLVNPTQVNNLAGKYVGGYGTPFDLAELANIPNLDISAITHVKLIDVIGSLADSLATVDDNGHKVNDPFPTPFDSGGFDLDAVGVIHENTSTAINGQPLIELVTIYPNPLTKNHLLHIDFPTPIPSNLKIELFSANGSLRSISTIQDNSFSRSFSDLPKGVYFLKINDNEQSIVKKIMVFE